MAGKALRDTSAGRCADHREGVSHIQSHKAEARHTSGVLTPAHKDTAMKKRRRGEIESGLTTLAITVAVHGGHLPG